jgi:hypothetical protein
MMLIFISPANIELVLLPVSGFDYHDLHLKSTTAMKLFVRTLSGRMRALSLPLTYPLLPSWDCGKDYRLQVAQEASAFRLIALLFEKPQTDIHDIGIILRPTMSAYFSEGLL